MELGFDVVVTVAGGRKCALGSSPKLFFPMLSLIPLTLKLLLLGQSAKRQPESSRTF
jgi:hypothetical protein